MDICNLSVHAIGAGAQVRWEDASGNIYRAVLEYDHDTKDVTRPLRLMAKKKGYYNSGPIGQWIMKRRPAAERQRGLSAHEIFMDSTNKRWSPVIAEILRRVESGCLIEKAREQEKIREAACQEAERAERARKIKEGIDGLAEKSEDGWFRKALIDISLHATRDDLFRLQIAVSR